MSDGTLESVLRRDRVIVFVALAALAALAWAYTLWLVHGMNMSGMGMTDMSADASSMNMDAKTGAMLAPAFQPWTGAHFIFMATMWSVMMIGMMTPSAAPMILLYARVGRQAASRGQPFAATGFFAGGYLLAWIVFSLCATLGQYLLERAALLTPMMHASSHLFGGLVLIAAGIFQWTALKDSCLHHCQAPLVFIQRHGGFQTDPLGSLSLGFHHGLYCVGCCWALMTLLFVGGVMNILWIALLTIFVLLEKVLPVGRILTRIAGLGLVAGGAMLLLSGLR
jgi:predicted metal-binding membrane protein